MIFRYWQCVKCSCLLVLKDELYNTIYVMVIKLSVI